MKRVVCVDPGIVNVGIVCATVIEGAIVNVSDVRIENLSKYSSGHMHDCIHSFFSGMAGVFDSADAIVIEKQPFTSAGYPLEIMFRERYGKQCVFICPQTLHKHFHLAAYEYNARKERSVEIVMAQLGAMTDVENVCRHIRFIESLPRKHDVCDAFLLLFVYASKQSTKQKSTSMDAFMFTPTDPLFHQKMRQRLRGL